MSNIQRAKSNPGITQADRPQEIPIDDPEGERRAWQQRGWPGHLRYLTKVTGCQVFSFGPGGYSERISEVYRRCFEPENDDPSKAGLGQGKLSVLSDFAAHYQTWFSGPNGCETSWISRGWDTDVLRALANGFRRAALLPMHQSRISRLEAARIALSSNDPRSLSSELKRAMEGIDLACLKEAAKGLPAVLAESAKISRQRIEEAVRKLTEMYPLIKPYEKDLVSQLGHGHIFKAKLLLVSKLFQVSPRALQRKA